MSFEIRAEVIISLFMAAEEMNSKPRELFVTRFQNINCFDLICLAGIT